MKRRCAMLEIENGKLREQIDEAAEKVLFLESLVEEQRAEIKRHHRDFARWEEMADKGARANEELRRLRANS